MELGEANGKGTPRRVHVRNGRIHIAPAARNAKERCAKVQKDDDGHISTEIPAEIQGEMHTQPEIPPKRQGTPTTSARSTRFSGRMTMQTIATGSMTCGSYVTDEEAPFRATRTPRLSGVCASGLAMFSPAKRGIKRSCRLRRSSALGLSRGLALSGARCRMGQARAPATVSKRMGALSLTQPISAPYTRDGRAVRRG